MKEAAVSKELSDYFRNRGLQPLGKLNAFNHADDASERSFIIDLAIGPQGTRGNRTDQQVQHDNELFRQHSTLIDQVVDDLRATSLFPKSSTSIQSWTRAPNPNPLWGIAVEIENNVSKYFLGSLLAASIAGRWGVLIAPNGQDAERWVCTINRMMHKGATSPIPSNIVIFSWPELQHKIRNG